MNNLTALITNQYNTGLVSNDKNIKDQILLIKDNANSIASKMGKNARQYAEENFHIETIVEKFIKIF